MKHGTIEEQLASVKFLQVSESVVDCKGQLVVPGTVIPVGEKDSWPVHRCARLVMRGQAVPVKNNPKPQLLDLQEANAGGL